MKILVTGGCGFIGSNFILNQFNTTKNQILNIDKLSYAGNLDNLKLVSNNSRYRFINQDICNQELLETHIHNFCPDTIVHFAAESHVDRSIDNPMSFINTNIIGTASLLNSSLKYWESVNNKSFKLLHISTDEVFGSLGKTGYFSESTPYDPSSPYSASKAS